MQILGFAYRNDSITVIRHTKKLFSATISEEKNTNNLCSFYYDKIKYGQYNKGIKLEIKLDSEGVNLLDTIVLISSNNQKPFISFLSPLKIQNKRTLFIGDGGEGFYDNVDK